MEQLLDAQEEVAQLQDEVARWKAAATLRSAVSSVSRADINDLEILLSLRESLNVSLQQLDQDITRTRAAQRRGGEGTSGDVLDVDSSRGNESEASLLFPKLRYELLLFRNVAELERLYRTGIRIGFDAPRILRLGLEKVSQLTNQWALFHQLSSSRVASEPSVSTALMPSYCYSKEWALPFRKALAEVVIALEMMPQQQNGSLATRRVALADDTMRQLRQIAESETILIELVQQTSDIDADAIREKIKMASSSLGGSLGGSAVGVVASAAAVSGKPSTKSSMPSSRSGSASGAPSPAAAMRATSPPKKQSGRPSTMSYLQSIHLGNKRSTSNSSAARTSADVTLMPPSHSTSSARARSPRHDVAVAAAQAHNPQTEPVHVHLPVALPPRAPAGVALTPAPAQLVGVDCMPATSGRSTSSTSLPDSRTASPSNVSVTSTRGVVGRTTPTKSTDVPRRIVLKSPSPKPNRTAPKILDADDDLASIVVTAPPSHPSLYDSTAPHLHDSSVPHFSPAHSSPPRSALKHWRDEEHHSEGLRGSGKRVTLSVPRSPPLGNEFDLSPQSPATSPPKPLQYHEVIPSRELSAEQPVRRREPQPTKVAPAAAIPASHPSPSGRQVRFAGDL
jgi:hypothetical protein